MTRSRRRQRGQVLPIVALAITVITAFTGLSVDLGHQFVVKRQLQAAADSAALAGATVLGGGSPTVLSTTPNTYNNAAVVAAHDYAAADGFVTAMPSSQGASASNNYSPDCYTGGGTSAFREMFFDSTYGTSCTSGFPSSGFTTAVQVNIPPQTIAGFPAVPTQCVAGTGQPDNCVQVVVTVKVSNYVMGIFGQPTEYLQAVATGYANPNTTSVSLPQSYAAYLYEPATSCTGQCYTPTTAPSKGALSCTNCPTVWAVNVGGAVTVNSIDGSTLTPATHIPAVVSAGHIVNQANPMIFCDTYGGIACANNSAAAGTTGYALGTGANLYCSGANAPSNATCTNTNPPGSLQKVTGNSTTYSSQTFTLPTPTQPTNDCGGLILNGDPITSGNSPAVFFDPTSGSAMASAPASCYPNSSEPYTIQPGRYKYIVINHGQYEFEGGLYWVYGQAPVNSATVSGTVEANGIDHSQETTGLTSDWDLCQSATNNAAGTKACPTLTAGVWIGHGLACNGSNKCGALVNSTGTTCSNGSVVGGTTGGGGDKTDITGSGVSFYFTSASLGLVSTNEVDSIVLSGPNLGALASVGNEPVLVNMQNNGWTHLDGNSGQNVQFTGMVYQTPTATAGGVDVDPGAGNHMTGDKATLVGQVLAWSLDFFGGHNGGNIGGIDFQYGYGTSSTTPAGAGSNETSLITVPSNALTSAGTGQEKLTVNYADEWMLDAYDLSIQVNSLTTYYFSKPLWSTPPNSYNAGTYSGSLPPQNGYTPSDSNPRYMSATQGTPTYPPPAPYVAGTGTNEYSYHTDLGQADDTVWDISGDWNWGNQSNITGAASHNFVGTVSYQFPVPTGSTVNIQMHVVDGDHCGDYDNVSVTLANVGSPSTGTSGVGGTVLVQ